MKFHEMTARQIAATNREQSLVVVPIAAVEQHGPHMPTGTDTILCTAVAQALEARLPDRVLITPTVWLGASAHHLRFGATIDSALDHYIQTLCDIGRSLLGDGFLRVWFLNGHGGNIDPMKVAARMLQPLNNKALIAAASYWAVADDLLREVLDGHHKFVGHACEFETSMMLHLRPELVQASRRDAGTLVDDNLHGVFLSRDMRHRTREGYTGRPDLATAEKGKALFNGIVDRLHKAAETLLAQPLGTTHADFAPNG